MATIDTEFPTSALLPKKETGASSFLSKYPEYDGRGITIAILDSGVDPGAAGMKVTSDGKIKVVERYDCTGAGDVNTTKVVRAENGEIKGLSGRKLKIPDGWKNPSGNYYIGLKAAYELYSPTLKERVVKDRKEKLWDPANKLAIAEVTRAIQEFEASYPSSSTLSGDLKLAREDLDFKLDELTIAEKKFNDPGPSYDCVVFHDGDVWRACIDTSECGNLASSLVLGEYNKTHDYKPLTNYDELNVSINVHDGGKTLEIVSMCSSHGTHVAAIAAAYHPEEPEKNGLAPGAQIVSLMIGDVRVDTMETGTGIVRAINRLMQTCPRPIHVVNMSYGEHTHYSLTGRIRELMVEVVDQHNIVWICSAGNNGPAVSTVSSPPNMACDAIIGIGAFVTPDMMTAEYSLRQKLPGLSYTWTSRGPTATGDMAVSVCSPGGAITSVPQFMLRNAQLMNGTSMASPNACGSVACLLGGMKSRNLPYTPYSVRRALENSALHQSTQDDFAQGQGLLQVEGAWEHLISYCNGSERNVRFQTSIPGLLGTNRGIYIRERPLEKPKDFTITVEPIFHQAKNLDVHQDKIDFNMKLALVCDKSWVSIPTHLNMTNVSRNIVARVDTTGLPTGIHFTQIRAYDVDCVEKGPVFRVPITVVQPIVLDNEPGKDIKFTNISFGPNTIQRHFIAVPEGATWAVVRITGPDKAAFMLHALQLRPWKQVHTHEYCKTVTLTPNVEAVLPFAVKGGLIMEVALAKHWADLGETTISYSLSLSGVKPDRDVVELHAAGGIHRVDVQCPLRAEEVFPFIVLKHNVQVCRPNESKIVPLSQSRDVLPPGRQIYELQLTYSFSLSKGTDVAPRSPLMSHLLYESEYESQLWMLFNSNKQYLSAGDAYPEKYQYPVKLEKGDYTIRMHVRHERRDLLDKLTDHPITIYHKLPSPLYIDVYATESQAVLGGKKMGTVSVPKGSVLPIYMAPLANDKFSKTATLGQFLSGTITYANNELGKKANVYSVRYLLTEAPKKSSSAASSNSSANNNNSNNNNNGSACGASNAATNGLASSNGDTPAVAGAAATGAQPPNKDAEGEKSTKTKYDEYLEAVRDLKTSWLSKLESGPQADALYDDLLTSFPDHVTVHVAMLNSLEPSSDISYWLPPVGAGESPQELDPKKVEQVLRVAQLVIDAVDQNVLLAYYGLKTDDQQDAAKIKTGMDRLKVALLESLSRKGIILCRQYLAGDTEGTMDKIKQIWKDIMKFTDAFDSRVIRFAMWHALIYKHYSRLLRYLFDEKQSREVDLKMISVMRVLGWEHYARHFECTHHTRYPPAYRPF